MNRRKAILKMGLIGGSLTLFYAGFKAWNLVKSPSILKLQENKMLIDDLAEAIIPKTDTPGAKDVNVGEFIIKMIKDCTPRQSQNNFIDGLIRVEDYANSSYSKSFSQCSPTEQENILSFFEKSDTPAGGIFGKVERKLMGDSFFVTLKKYTVIGYCTSELGAKQGLSYDYIPGKYVGETILLPGQKAWATQ
jgi:Gluconate 2-dehydrogenase subunit 3